jgi:hypothetical protein
MLIRYHRPGFDDLPSKVRANLGADTCAHTNAFLEALRKLVTFLEHGRLNYRGPAAIQVASRDITAAVLRDVDGLTNREIGERLCVPLPADFQIKADHPTMSKMSGRGRGSPQDGGGGPGDRGLGQGAHRCAARTLPPTGR